MMNKNKITKFLAVVLLSFLVIFMFLILTGMASASERDEAIERDQLAQRPLSFKQQMLLNAADKNEIYVKCEAQKKRICIKPDFQYWMPHVISGTDLSLSPRDEDHE